MNTSSSPASDIEDPRSTAKAETNDLFAQLRRLMADCGNNKHDQAIILLTACVEQGINTAPRLMGVMEVLGFKRQHVGILLSDATGSSLERHRWSRDGAGVYTLIE